MNISNQRDYVECFHSYVDLSQVGRPDYHDGDDVQCITDLTTCCRGTQGLHRGDWYFPNGTQLPFAATETKTYEQREAQRVDLRRNRDANPPTGIYRCGIPTDADCNSQVRLKTAVCAFYTSYTNRSIPHSHRYYCSPI